MNPLRLDRHLGRGLAAAGPPQRHGRLDRPGPAPCRDERGRGLPGGLRGSPTRGHSARRSRRTAESPAPPHTTGQPGELGHTSPTRLAGAESRHAASARARRSRAPRSPSTTSLSDDGTRLRAWTNDPDGTASTAPRSCSATASAPTRGPGRRCSTPTAASGSCPGTTAAPAARTVRRTRTTCGIEEFVEDALVGDGPLRHRPGRADGLVDGRQHDVRAGPAPPRAGLRAVRGRRGARRHVRAPCWRRSRCPALLAARASPSTSPGC